MYECVGVLSRWKLAHLLRCDTSKCPPTLSSTASSDRRRGHVDVSRQRRFAGCGPAVCFPLPEASPEVVLPGNRVAYATTT